MNSSLPETPVKYVLLFGIYGGEGSHPATEKRLLYFLLVFDYFKLFENNKFTVFFENGKKILNFKICGCSGRVRCPRRATAA